MLHLCRGPSGGALKLASGSDLVQVIGGEVKLKLRGPAVQLVEGQCLHAGQLSGRNRRVAGSLELVLM